MPYFCPIFSISFVAQHVPVAATNVMATNITATNATIKFTISRIVYTVETYIVVFMGTTFQKTKTFSLAIFSTITIIEEKYWYIIILTDLEEDNTYTYTVNSTNCVGTTSTEEMTFRTLPACKRMCLIFIFNFVSSFLPLVRFSIPLCISFFCPIFYILSSLYTVPVASPMNCANTTFLPRNATLNWTEPELIDQNGARVGYNLTCMNTNGVSVNGLNATQTSNNTMFTITDVMPFTSYTCDLSFINVVGQGPSTQCTFTTAQDSKLMQTIDDKCLILISDFCSLFVIL